MNLVFTCKTKEGFDKLKAIIDKSDFYADAINYEFRSLFFDCKSQADADSLEKDLAEITSQYDIPGHFEVED